MLLRDVRSRVGTEKNASEKTSGTVNVLDTSLPMVLIADLPNAERFCNCHSAEDLAMNGRSGERRLALDFKPR